MGRVAGIRPPGSRAEGKGGGDQDESRERRARWVVEEVFLAVGAIDAWDLVRLTLHEVVDISFRPVAFVVPLDDLERDGGGLPQTPVDEVTPTRFAPRSAVVTQVTQRKEKTQDSQVRSDLRQSEPPVCSRVPADVSPVPA